MRTSKTYSGLDCLEAVFLWRCDHGELHHSFMGRLGLLRRCRHVGSIFSVSFCPGCLSKVSQPSPTSHCQHHWSPEEKKWGDMTSPSLITTPRNIRVARGFAEMTITTSLGYRHNHLSFFLVDSMVSIKVFLIREKSKHSWLFVLQIAQQALHADQTVIFCLWSH